MTKKLSHHSLEFTSISELLKKHGYKHIDLLSSAVYRELFTCNSTCTWFPELGFIVCDLNNQVIHVKKSGDLWFKRNGRNNAWYCVNRKSNTPFAEYMNEKYEEHIALMIET